MYSSRSPRVAYRRVMNSMSPTPSLKPTRFGHSAASRSTVADAVLGVGAVVDDDAQRGRLADRPHVGDQAVLPGLGEVGREQQDRVGPGGLGVPGERDRLGGALPGRGDDRDGAGGLVGGGAHDLADLFGREREELAGAAGREQARRREGRQVPQVLAVAGLVEGQVLAEVGDGEGQEPLAQRPLDLCGGVSRHVRRSPVPSRCARTVTPSLIPVQHSFDID